MKISEIKTLGLRIVWGKNIDLLLAASGYESRSKAAAQYLNRQSNIKIKNKLAFGFTEHRDNNVRKKNDLKFKKLGYKIILSSGSDSSEVEKVIVDFLRKLFKFTLNPNHFLLQSVSFRFYINGVMHIEPKFS